MGAPRAQDVGAASRPGPPHPASILVHVEEDFAVVNKPAGMVVHRDAHHLDAVAVLQTVRDALGRRVHPVHRLDKPTSGLLAVAFDRRGAGRLQRSLEGADKRYTALLRWPRRRPTQAGERWETDWMLPNKRGNPKPARTRFTLLERFGRCALAEVRLFAGRYHQVRQHAHRARTTVLGDPVYGPAWLCRWAGARWGLGRMFLHMGRLEFAHPRTAQPLQFTAPLPADLAAVLARLRDAGETTGT